jgi:hypothetical protein
MVKQFVLGGRFNCAMLNFIKYRLGYNKEIQSQRFFLFTALGM